MNDMDKITEADNVRENVVGFAMAPNVAESMLVHETQFKQETLEQQWPETCANVYDSIFDVEKHEVHSNSSKLEHLMDNISNTTVTDFSLSVKVEPPECKASIPTEMWNTDKRQPATSSKCLLTAYEIPIMKKLKVEHDDVTNISCNKCNFRCVYRSTLNRHMRAHNEEKQLSCKYCDYKSLQASDLKTHMEKHGEKPYFCTHCDYNCAYASHLSVHMKVHTGERPYSCTLCDYKCSQASHLKAHIKIHTGEKPFLCNHCDYKCSSVQRLKAHLRSSTPSSLYYHLQTHTGEKPLSCDHCDYKTARRGHLVNHLKKHCK